MTSTKNKFMSFILSFIMAFTVFGVLGTAQVNAAEDVAFTVTLSTTLDEDVTNDSTIKATQIVKEFTAEELDQLADVTNQKYMFSKDGKSANVYKVDKGVELETLIKAAVGETADVNSYAGLKLWDAADLSKYYKKLANFKDHMIADTYYYGGAEYDTETGAIDFGEGTVVEPVLALDFEYATLNADTAGTKADDLTFTEDTELRNRVFLGMLNSEERGGFWSQTNSFGIDLMGRKRLYGYMESYYTISPSYMGMGNGMVSTVLEAVEKNGNRRLHSDVLRMYIELGMPMFLLWCAVTFILTYTFFARHYSLRSARMYFAVTVLMYVTFLTDNTLEKYCPEIAWHALPLGIILAEREQMAAALRHNDTLSSERSPSWRKPKKEKTPPAGASILNPSSEEETAAEKLRKFRLKTQSREDS